MVDFRRSKKSPSGLPITMQSHREGTPVDFLSPNWCDKTTWWYTSTPVVDETLTDSGDGLTWDSVNVVWIDVTHGKITQEHRIHATHKLVVKVDSVEKTEHPPGTTDGDYTVDHLLGKVTFDASQAGKTVTATYSKMVDSAWVVTPDTGKKIRFTVVEVQFTHDIVLNDTVVFEFYGIVDVFAPQLLDSADPPGPFPSGTKIPLGSPRRYQTMMDYINEAQRAYAEFPAIGGGSWRGLQQKVQILRWPYQEEATRDLMAAAGMEVRIRLENDNEFGGTNAYVTLYAMSEEE